MELNALPRIEPRETASDHGFIFDAHNHDRSQLITRYRGTSVVPTASGKIVTGWQKSIYHFGGLNREVPVVVTAELDLSGKIQNICIDEQSVGSQGKRCNFSCLEELCNCLLCGSCISDLNRTVTSAPDVKCLHLFEILSACSSFCAYLSSCDLQEGMEHEYIAICPESRGLSAESTHEINGNKDHTLIRLDYLNNAHLNENGLVDYLDAAATLQYNEEEVLKEELKASDFEAVYTQLNRFFSRCHHIEKRYFGINGRARFFNTPSLAGLFLLTISHSNITGKVFRAVKIEKILHYLQTGYGKDPCKGFGG